MKFIRLKKIRQQQGLALYLALIMLIVIAIIGVASSRGYVNSVTNSRNLEIRLLAETASDSILASSMDLLLADAIGTKQIINDALRDGGVTICYDDKNNPVAVKNESSCKPLHWKTVGAKTSVAVNDVRTSTVRLGGCFGKGGYSSNVSGALFTDLIFRTTAIGAIQNSQSIQEQTWSMIGPPPEGSSNPCAGGDGGIGG